MVTVEAAVAGVRGVTHAAGARVLVVDDERLVRWALRERLLVEGYEVTEAGTVAEALAQVDSDPELVLLDVRLPDGSGLDVLRGVLQRAPQTPVVLMTAFSDLKDAGDAVSRGAYDLLHKPFNLDDVALLVARGIEVGRLRRAAVQSNH